MIIRIKFIHPYFEKLIIGLWHFSFLFFFFLPHLDYEQIKPRNCFLQLIMIAGVSENPGNYTEQCVSRRK